MKEQPSNMQLFYASLMQLAFWAGYDEASGGFRHENDHTFTSQDRKAAEIWGEYKEQGRKQYLSVYPKGFHHKWWLKSSKSIPIIGAQP